MQVSARQGMVRMPHEDVWPLEQLTIDIRTVNIYDGAVAVDRALRLGPAMPDGRLDG